MIVFAKRSPLFLSVVRSGDYYLFETDSEEEEEDDEKKDEEPPKRSAFLVSEPLLVCRGEQTELLWSQTYNQNSNFLCK